MGARNVGLLLSSLVFWFLFIELDLSHFFFLFFIFFKNYFDTNMALILGYDKLDICIDVLNETHLKDS
jgi:hypothetical protein